MIYSSAYWVKQMFFQNICWFWFRMPTHCQASVCEQSIELSHVWDAATSEYILSLSMLYELSLQTFIYHSYCMKLSLFLQSLYFIITWVPLFKIQSYSTKSVLPNLEILILIQKISLLVYLYITMIQWYSRKLCSCKNSKHISLLMC